MLKIAKSTSSCQHDLAFPNNHRTVQYWDVASLSAFQLPLENAAFLPKQCIPLAKENIGLQHQILFIEFRVMISTHFKGSRL